MSASEISQADKANGSISDVARVLMPSMGSSKMPKRLVKVIPANPNYNKTDKLMQKLRNDASIVTGSQYTV